MVWSYFESYRISAEAVQKLLSNTISQWSHVVMCRMERLQKQIMMMERLQKKVLKIERLASGRVKIVIISKLSKETEEGEEYLKKHYLKISNEKNC